MCTDSFLATLPVGGEKGSGWGRSNANWGMAEFMTFKLITISMKKARAFI